MNIKALLPLLLVTSISADSLQAQNYYAENEVTLTLKETNGPQYRFFSNALFMMVNMGKDELTITVDFKSFHKHDSTGTVNLEAFFPAEEEGALVFKALLPFNNLDKDVSNKQMYQVQGNLMIDGRTYPYSLPIEFDFSDRQMLFKTQFTLDINMLGLNLPAEYKDRISPVLLFQVESGHLIYRSKS